MTKNKVVEQWMLNAQDFFRSHHIQLALTAGVSIIVLEFVSKRVLEEPMDSLARAFPPLLAVIAVGVITKYRGARIATTWYWVVAILLATILIITLHII